MTEDNIRDLQQRVAKLHRLLSEPWEPGLFTWIHTVNDEWWEIVKWAPDAARRLLGPGDPTPVLRTEDFPPSPDTDSFGLPDKEVGIKGGKLALEVATVVSIDDSDRPAELFRTLGQERDPLVLQTALVQAATLIKGLAQALDEATGEDSSGLLLRLYGQRLAEEGTTG